MARRAREAFATAPRARWKPGRCGARTRSRRICEGLRNDILARGVAGEKVTVIPNAVDVETFAGLSCS